MASSMLQSERRWTSRKSSMTVLGKVPKPINLPSQKLENHGLDPNVEIVPKGTLTWGTRPLLAASSAWGSSTLSSPRADGSVGSPIHSNGRPSSGGSGTRPSSGGSGTRPSTGSSERSSEPASIPWGPSSRPSSASGAMSHMSVAVNRPRSAETRPNSSQLSRFAECSSDSIAWGAAGVSEKVTSEASQRSGFTLSSGDFPTLGSEKFDESNSQQGQRPKVHAPVSDLISTLKGTSESVLASGSGNPALALHGNINSWNTDTHLHAGEGASVRTENWHRDNHILQPLLDANLPPPQYGSWHGPARHANVVWYGGPDTGSLYRPPFGPPGSYHVDPYYPYVPAGPLPNTQAFLRAEAIPGGVHLKKGEVFRHIPPEPHIAHGHSGIPVRPAVYPTPVVFEGCYGPTHASFENSSGQDVSSMNMPGQCSVRNQYVYDNLRLQPMRFHDQPDVSVSVMTKQPMISGQANEIQGQYKVLLKQHGSQEDKDTLEKHTLTVWPTYSQSCSSAPEPDLLDDNYKQDRNADKQHGNGSHSQHSKDSIYHDNGNSLGNSSAGHNVIKKLDTITGPVSDKQNVTDEKSTSLMEKIEGLNSKVQEVDTNFEDVNFPSKEKLRSKQNSSSDVDLFEKVGLTNLNSATFSPIYTKHGGTRQLNTLKEVIKHESVPGLKPTHQSDEKVFASGKSEEGVYLQSDYQKRVRNVKGKADHHGNLKFGSYAADEMNISFEKDSLEKNIVTTGKNVYLLSIPGSHASEEAVEDQSSQLVFKSVNDPCSLKSVDLDAQHAKLKELARQRAIELQKEEEERTAELKAKALVKLEELNRRTSASLKQNSRNAQPLCSDSPNKHDTISDKDAKTTAVSENPLGVLPCAFDLKNHPNNDKNLKFGDSLDLPFAQPSMTSDSSVQPCASVNEQSLQLGKESISEVTTARTTLVSQDGIVSRRRQGGHRRRRNITDEQNQSEKLANSENSRGTRSASMVSEDRLVGLEILDGVDPPMQPSKSNHGPKYKNNLSDSHLNTLLSFSTHPDRDFEKFEEDSDEMKASAMLLEEPVQVSEKNSNENFRGQDANYLLVAPNLAGYEPTNLRNESSSNNCKPQLHRKPVRKLQSDKANTKHQGSETVVWAPVKVVNKDGSSEEVHKSSGSEGTNLSDGKNVQGKHSGAKARRAEMERYVPKPIAKESSFQGDFHQTLPSVSPASFYDQAGKPATTGAVTAKDVNSAIAKSALISGNTECNKQNRLGKARPSWRQRISGESSSREQSASVASLSSEPSKFVEKTYELQHSRSSDVVLVEGRNELQEESMTTLNIKQHGIVKQKRQQFKHRVDGSSYGLSHSKVLQDEVSDKLEMQSPGSAQTGERNPSRNEHQNAGSGHMRSHWQPKFQVHSQHCFQDYKGSQGHHATDKLQVSQSITENLSGSDSGGHRNRFDVDDMRSQEGYRESEVMTSEHKNSEGKNWEGSRGLKVMKQPSNDQNQSIDCDSRAPTESSYVNTSGYKQHQGEPRHGQNRDYYFRGGDAIYGGERKIHSTGDMRNAEQHFEYKISQDKDGDRLQQNYRASEEAAETHKVSSGYRYAEQGRNHSRRGGQFYGHRRGT